MSPELAKSKPKVYCSECYGALQRNHKANFDLKSICCTRYECSKRGVDVK